MCNKIEKLINGDFFLGAGHLFTIGKAKRWAQTGFHEADRPEFGEIFTDDAAEFSFSCLVISKDGNDVTLIDDEMEPTIVLDDIVGLGTGGASARAARAAGASMERAVEIAIQYDSNSGGPVRTYKIP